MLANRQQRWNRLDHMKNIYEFIFFNWDSFHAGIDSHYEAWSQKGSIKGESIQEVCLERTYK